MTNTEKIDEIKGLIWGKKQDLELSYAFIEDTPKEIIYLQVVYLRFASSEKFKWGSEIRERLKEVKNYMAKVLGDIMAIKKEILDLEINLLAWRIVAKKEGSWERSGAKLEAFIRGKLEDGMSLAEVEKGLLGAIEKKKANPLKISK